MSKKLEIGSTWGSGLYIAAYIIVIVIHPLHYYAYVIKQDQNCLEIDNELYATVAPVLFFNAYMMLYTPYFFKRVIAPRNSKTVIGHFIFTQIPILFMTLTVILDLTTGTTDKIFLTIANLFLFGYILLVIGLSLTIKYATEGTSYLAHAKWSMLYTIFFFTCLEVTCFGQSLLPSTFITENIFVVSIIIYSTVLFVFLIGNMQTYLAPEDKQTESEKKEKEMSVLLPIHEEMTLFQVQEPEQSTLILKEQTAEQCVSFRKLRQELQMEVINNLQLNKWRATKILHIETLFNILPEDLLRDIKIELCLPQLRNIKVEEFRNLGELALKDLCYHVKLVFYLDRTLIFREGDPITEMLFVLHGEIRTHNSRGIGYLKDGGFFGKELVTSFNNQAEAYLSSLPISPRTVQAITNVEAFVLMAYDLKKIFTKHNQQQTN
ncbi:putative cyclic nucleotide-gated ion channel 13 isoform X1 [Pistacia vera]|uniref:putative cyclic nucleotide-gated ion channel 13 isoform X1 n=1 Tax=Pistacia vera TaxID=55513 RepID=UPI001263CC7A|nr:putative cyclic nucleotide-gated ion channel 13 isoform X1 [Pistacia vera]